MFLPKTDKLTWKFRSKNYYKLEDGRSAMDIYEDDTNPMIYKRYIIPNEIFDFYEKWTRYIFSVLDPMIQQRTGFFAPNLLNVSTVRSWGEEITYGLNIHPHNIIVIYLCDILSNCCPMVENEDTDITLNHFHAMGQIIFVCCHELFHSALYQTHYYPPQLESETSACALNFMAENLDYLESIVKLSISDTVMYNVHSTYIVDLRQIQVLGSSVGNDAHELMINQYVTKEKTLEEDYCFINCEGWIYRFFESMNALRRIKDDLLCRDNFSIKFAFIYQNLYYGDMKCEYSPSIIIKEDGIYQKTAPALLTNWLARYYRYNIEQLIAFDTIQTITLVHGKKFVEVELVLDLTDLQEPIIFENNNYDEEDEEES
jgi:hypothetical protein